MVERVVSTRTDMVLKKQLRVLGLCLQEAGKESLVLAWDVETSKLTPSDILPL